MNPKRAVVTIIAVFVALFATDYVIHSVWLMNDYRATASLWRPESEMGSHFAWLLLGQCLATVMFVLIWANGFPVTATLRGAFLYGACMGLFMQSNTLISYAVQPLPVSIAEKWFVSGVGQGIVLGLVAYFVYRPKSAAAAAAALAAAAK
jgi:hypothetical protein